MNARAIYSLVADLETDIAAAEAIAELLTVLSGSRSEMPCMALGPLSDLLRTHVGSLDAKFKELHHMTGGRDRCA
nr:hypothetical protein NG677_20055 [Methylobacterium sp. OTU13CASTA1]